MQNVMNGAEVRYTRANVAKLLKTIKANHLKHKNEYETALAGYYVEVGEAIEAKKAAFYGAINELCKKVDAGEKAGIKAKPVSASLPSEIVRFNCIPPVDHSSEYEVVIGMLEYETRKEIDLDQERFECYVMDRWQWKAAFAESVMNYSSKLAAAPVGAPRRRLWR